MVKEPNIAVILYDEDSIESNAKIYSYHDKEKGRNIYAQKSSSSDGGRMIVSVGIGLYQDIKEES